MTKLQNLKAKLMKLGTKYDEAIAAENEKLCDRYEEQIWELEDKIEKEEELVSSQKRESSQNDETNSSKKEKEPEADEDCCTECGGDLLDYGEYLECENCGECYERE